MNSSMPMTVPLESLKLRATAVSRGRGPSTGTATSPRATRPASASMASRRRLSLPACRVVWRVEVASQPPSSVWNWGVSGALARRSSVVMGRHLRVGGGQAGRRIGGQLLAEPLAGAGQAEAGGVGADAERQGSLGRAQLRIGDQLQDLAIPGRHGA